MGEQLLIAALSFLFLPVIIVVALVIILATCGTSIGIRKAYVKLMLKVFEACKHKVPVPSPGEQDNDTEEENEIKQDNTLSDAKQDNEDQADKSSSSPSVKGLEQLDFGMSKKEFELSDVMTFAKFGMEAIIDDTVTKRFSAEELPSWNLLTRTQKDHQFMSIRLTALWCVGCFVRYAILLPFRITIAFIGVMWLIISTAFIGYLRESSFKRKLNEFFSLMSFRILCRAFSGVITFHNRENMAKNGICVANHTSPVDVIILSCDNCYAMIGQSHGGFLGVIQRSLARATAHIWFERSEAKDRGLVARRLKSHIEDKNKLPVLIFPEGTCINNTSVMMFKKGSFEVSSVIYPVAIKYDPRFGDAFWNSSKHNWTQHLLQIMSSWALVCDVWYLPPMTKLENEDAVAFANRVKSEIAKKGGLVDLDWDGGLKRENVKESMKEVPQELYSKMLKVD
ncbi:glycerol-3-phosphate acyltransferase 3-like isoform X1 [Biomphalaria glabrata]|uniref:Glycerol-3-phosphate acyltransferase 3-like isoform X1 n=1 Tax=Biomphalaria glabrata TaxID=6526 RepID=A0A2C9LBV5_BIOGL|nr:glycerol-3-phosphate acyltransferase 3-like isoform X1 [Biomphalaria glabrata]KAI8769868.1 glycerol-3-phosphate acyltransferase 3-like isoform X1 [Biomphalaria glabrata]